jgi:ribosome-binding protein aMBF1 (putative translation factor)
MVKQANALFTRVRWEDARDRHLPIKHINVRSPVAKRIQAETPAEVRIFTRQYTDIVLRINQILKAKGYTQKDLAQKLNKNPSEINKWLKGNHNLTLKTIAKLEAELGEPIIYTSRGQLENAMK